MPFDVLAKVCTQKRQLLQPKHGSTRVSWHPRLQTEGFCWSSLINNNNNRDDIYGAVTMQSHCESSPGSSDECRLSTKVSANPQAQTKPIDLDCEFARKKWQLPSTSTIAILLLLSPRADTHFTVPRRVEGWVNLGTAVRVCSPCPRLYIAVAVVINTTASGEIRTWVLSHLSQAC